jgi:hypothetical protein
LSALEFDLSGLGLRVGGLRSRLAEDLAAVWRGFALPIHGAPTFTVEVHQEPPSEEAAPFTPKAMRSSHDEGRCIFTLAQGAAAVAPSGGIEVSIAATTPSIQHAALVNLLTAAIAWRLPQHEGLLMHAAGIVIDGRAFLLVGGEGAGKTTWASLARDAGADVLGDDVVLVHRGPRVFEALASPFRAELSTLRAPGRWPLAAVLGASHATTASLQGVSPLVARARLTANIPFAIDGFGSRQAVWRIIDRLADEVPHRALAFAKAPSFLTVLREARFESDP